MSRSRDKVKCQKGENQFTGKLAARRFERESRFLRREKKFDYGNLHTRLEISCRLFQSIAILAEVMLIIMYSNLNILTIDNYVLNIKILIVDQFVFVFLQI